MQEGMLQWEETLGSFLSIKDLYNKQQIKKIADKYSFSQLIYDCSIFGC